MPRGCIACIFQIIFKVSRFDLRQGQTYSEAALVTWCLQFKKCHEHRTNTGPIQKCLAYEAKLCCGQNQNSNSNQHAKGKEMSRIINWEVQGCIRHNVQIPEHTIDFSVSLSHMCARAHTYTHAHTHTHTDIRHRQKHTDRHTHNLILAMFLLCYSHSILQTVFLNTARQGGPDSLRNHIFKVINLFGENNLFIYPFMFFTRC